MNLGEWIPLVAIGGSYLLVGFVVWSIVRSRQRRAELRAQVQSKLIERFNTGPELIQFLESRTGKELVDSFERLPVAAANERIITGIRRGIILTLLGVAFIGVWAVQGDRDMAWPAFMLLALGISFFISAYVSMRLARSWGLSPRDTDRTLDT